jgi:hypothetical protein
VVNFESISDLITVLKGQNTLINITSIPNPSFTIRLIDTAVTASIYQIIPAEFSSDLINTKA